MIRRVVGVLLRPRSTMAEVAAQPDWLSMWLLILIISGACALALVSTTVGRQALVDERVRVIETLGGSVDDAAYAALQTSPPISAYFTGGGRVLLNPVVTLLVALGIWFLARADGSPATGGQALAVAVHASLALLVGQLVATPLHYLRESLTSPTNLAVFMPGLDEGSMPARLFGSIEVFGLWWLWLLALGLAALTHRPAGRYFLGLAGFYVVVAAVLAAVLAVLGGS